MTTGTGFGVSKLTPELHAQIVERTRAIGFMSLAAEFYGVPRRTLEDWIAVGRGLHLTRKPSKPYRDFAADMMKAVAEFTQRQLAELMGPESSGMNRKEWRRRAWVLEKINRDLFGEKTEVEMTGAIGSYVIEAPPQAADLDEWRNKYTPVVAAQKSTPIVGSPTGTNGIGNGHAGNGHAGTNGSGNGHSG